MMQDLANNILKYYSWCDDVEATLRDGHEFILIEGHQVKGQTIIETTVIRDLLGFAYWIQGATDED